LKISHRTREAATKLDRLPAVTCLVDDSSVFNDSPQHLNARCVGYTCFAKSFCDVHLQEAAIDLKLPRRSLLVQFTCNACGERSQKLINRLAYERGTVFVQCSGCFKHHQLVDNLGLVVEYDFREDISVEPSADQV
ncbi:hypothetical protein RJ639_001413, partial [Escallonia herrerae]